MWCMRQRDPQNFSVDMNAHNWNCFEVAAWLQRVNLGDIEKAHRWCFERQITGSMLLHNVTRATFSNPTALGFCIQDCQKVWNAVQGLHRLLAQRPRHLEMDFDQPFNHLVSTTRQHQTMRDQQLKSTVETLNGLMAKQQLKCIKQEAELKQMGEELQRQEGRAKDFKAKWRESLDMLKATREALGVTLECPNGGDFGGRGGYGAGGGHYGVDRGSYRANSRRYTGRGRGHSGYRGTNYRGTNYNSRRGCRGGGRNGY